MEQGRYLKHRIGYEALFRALGHFCDQESLDEVGLIEFEKGFILQGIKVAATEEGYIRRIITRTWSYEDVNQMASALQAEQPAPEE